MAKSETLGKPTLVCRICPRHCALQEGQTGYCRARRCIDSKVTSLSYGIVTALALDPIEKKPLYHFYPGSLILSVGSFGCNMRCSFCQNHSIAQIGIEGAKEMETVPPKRLVETALAAKGKGNIGLAFTYNEPLVGYEYVLDSAKLATQAGLYNVLVTNGMVCQEPLRALLPYIHAMNIDLKSFREESYRSLGGDLETVKSAIATAAGVCHVEVTTLVVPGMNDSVEEIGDIAAWIGSLSRDIPFHISRFFPRWVMADREATPVDTVYALAETAKQHLQYVYTGNC